MEIKESKIAQTLAELRKLADPIKKYTKRAIPQTQLLQKCIKDLDPRVVLETATELHKKLNEFARKLNEYATKLDRLVKGLPKTASQAMKDDLYEIKTLHDTLWDEVDKTHREIGKLMRVANSYLNKPGRYGHGQADPVNELFNTCISAIECIVKYLQKAK